MLAVSGRQPGELFLFRGQFLYLRQIAGRLFFFRRRKKNQERRHPFERVDDDLGALPPSPPPSIDGRPSREPLLPALPCRPGETFLVAAVRFCLFFAGFLPIPLFSRCGKTCTPGPQGGPGRSRWGDMSKFPAVRGPGGLAPWSASTASKRWRLFRFLFGRSKRNIDNGWMPFIQLPTAPFLLTSFSDERSKARGGMLLKNTARNFKKIFRFLLGHPKGNEKSYFPASLARASAICRSTLSLVGPP